MLIDNNTFYEDEEMRDRLRKKHQLKTIPGYVILGTLALLITIVILAIKCSTNF